MKLLFFSLLILSAPYFLSAADLVNPFVEVRRTEGTGRTTGHIATLTVKNLGFEPTVIVPATYYIPSDLIYQSYVGRITDTVRVGEDEVVEIKLFGYCADVSKPPARAKRAMIDFKEWILMVPPNQEDNRPLVLRPDRQLKPWDVGKVPAEVRFTITPTEGTSVNWPGTQTKVSGLILPDKEPFETSSLIVAYLEELENAAIELRQQGRLRSPFQNQPDKEFTTLVQHAFWIVMARLTGVPYDREVFSERVNLVASVTTSQQAAQRERGIVAFWRAFMQIGVKSSAF